MNKLRFIRSKRVCYFLAVVSVLYPILGAVDRKNILSLGFGGIEMEQKFKAHPDFLTGRVSVARRRDLPYMDSI